MKKAKKTKKVEVEAKVEAALENVSNERENKEMMRLYDIVFELVSKEFIQGTEPLAIAAVLVSTGLRMYKTSLNDEHFHEATSYIFGNLDKIQPFGEQVTLQ